MVENISSNTVGSKEDGKGAAGHIDDRVSKIRLDFLAHLNEHLLVAIVESPIIGKPNP